MKGMELAISTLIIIVIALIIFLAFIFILYGNFNPTSKAVTLEAATRATCQKASVYCKLNTSDIYTILNAARTPVESFDANKDGKMSYQYYTIVGIGMMSHFCKDDNLEALCEFYYGCAMAGCPAGGNPTGAEFPNPAAQKAWWQCCMKNICGC
jgi:hypothetical protein